MNVQRIPKVYFSIHVRGYEGRTLAYQIYHDEVYISETDRFSGPNKQIKFNSEKEALKYLEKRKDRDRYKFSIVKTTSWE